jgi:hypothetical protein
MSVKRRPLNGKHASTPGELQSSASPTMPSKDLQKLLASVYDQFQKLDNPKADAKAKQDFIFHMTDWLDDLQRLTAIYEHPNTFGRSSAGRDIVGFLYHVIPHLKAAGRLLLNDVPDAFETAEARVPNDRIRRATPPRRRAPSPKPR